MLRAPNLPTEFKSTPSVPQRKEIYHPCTNLSPRPSRETMAMAETRAQKREVRLLRREGCERVRITATMASPGTFRLLCSLTILLAITQFAAAWKEAEFRKCHQSKFCKDVRERAAAWARGEGGREIEVRDVSLKDGRVTARLVPTGNENDALVMELSTYRDGIVRIKVLEEKAPHKRFELPHVVVNDFEQKLVGVSRIQTKDGASVVQLSSGHDVIILHKPFQVSYPVCFLGQSGRNLNQCRCALHNAVLKSTSWFLH